MIDIGRAFALALALIANPDSEFLGIVLLSLKVSGSAAILAFLLGAPLGALLAVLSFRGRDLMIVGVNALLGLPPVVVGLLVYLLVSRTGPLGAMGLLFTPTAMVIAQLVLATPIVIALTHRISERLWADYGDALLVDGASTPRAVAMFLAMARTQLATVFLAAFGRSIAEVGAIMVVGGNIRGVTRTMTTAIALETSRGDLAFALALGLVLIGLTLAVSALGLLLGRGRTL
jgi:tungstate transport system permease protein